MIIEDYNSYEMLYSKLNVMSEGTINIENGRNLRQRRSHGAWSAEHGAELRFACGSLGITSFL